jgi:hypothetical protein
LGDGRIGITRSKAWPREVALRQLRRTGRPSDEFGARFHALLDAYPTTLSRAGAK